MWCPLYTIYTCFLSIILIDDIHYIYIYINIYCLYVFELNFSFFLILVSFIFFWIKIVVSLFPLMVGYCVWIMCIKPEWQKKKEEEKFWLDLLFSSVASQKNFWHCYVLVIFSIRPMNFSSSFWETMVSDCDFSVSSFAVHIHFCISCLAVIFSVAHGIMICDICIYSWKMV